MANKDFNIRHGLTVANTVLVTNNQNVGIGNTTPTDTLRVEGVVSVKDKIVIANTTTNATINSTGIFHSGIINASSFGPISTTSNVIVGSTFTANTLGVFTQTINASSINATSVNATSINATSINSASLSVNNSTLVTYGSNVGIGNTTPTDTLRVEGVVSVKDKIIIANATTNATINSTGIYHSGIISGSSFGPITTTANLIVGSTFVANTLGTFATTVNATTINATTFNATTVKTGSMGTGTGGANLVATGLSVGNDTINSVITSTGLTVNGVSIVNAAGFYAATVNATSIKAGAMGTGTGGANLVATGLTVGNDTINSVMTSAGLTVNGASIVNAAGLYVTTANATSFKTGAMGTGTGGANLVATGLTVGNNTINSVMTSAGLTVNGTSVVNATGVYVSTVNASAVNAATVNATTLTTDSVLTNTANATTVNATTVNATSFKAGAMGAGTGGANLVATGITIGNNTINSVITSAGLTVNGASVINAAGAYVATVNATSVLTTTANATSFKTGAMGGGTGGANLVATGLTVGNDTINSVMTSAGLTVNGTAVVNSTTFSIGSTSANSSGVYTPTINAASHTIGSTLVANTLGVYHTGTMNSASFTVGNTSNSTTTGGFSVTSSTLIIGNSNINTSITSAGISINAATIANSTGVYSNNINATTFSVGTATTVNSTLITTTGSINASSLNVTGIANVGGNLRVLGDLIITGNTVSSGNSVAAGDFLPTANGFNLGNTTARWGLIGATANLSGGLTSATYAFLTSNVQVGSNVLVDTAKVFISNSIANSTSDVGGLLLQSTGSGNTVINPNYLSFVSSGANAPSGLINSTQISTGSNSTYTGFKATQSGGIEIGNTTANLIAKQTIVSVSNTIGNSYVTPTLISVQLASDGTTASVNSTTLSLSNSTSTANALSLTRSSLSFGNATVNTTISTNSISVPNSGYISLGGSGGLTANTTAVNIGNSSVNTSLKTTSYSVSDAENKSTVNTTQIYVGNNDYSATVDQSYFVLSNTSAYVQIGGLGTSNSLTANSSGLRFGNSITNATVTSQSITIANAGTISLGSIGSSSNGLLANTSSLQLGNSSVTTVVNVSTIKLGNSTVNTFVNTSTIFTGNIGVNTTSTAYKVDVYGGARSFGFVSSPLITPTVALSWLSSGGTLADGNYGFIVVAIDGNGGTSNPSSANTTNILGPSASATLSWTPISGAVSYQVWYSYNPTIGGALGTYGNYFTTSNASITLTTLTGNTSGTISTTDTSGRILLGNTTVNTSIGANSIVVPNSGYIALGSVNATSNGLLVNTTSLMIGNSSVNVVINSTAFTGSANNASFLGTIAAANYVKNTDSRTLSGNLTFSANATFSGANVLISGTSLNVTSNASFGTVTTGALSTGNLVVAGNLTVTGTTTYVNTTILNISDNLITLNADVTGAPSENAGLEINRGTSANVQIRWNESGLKWEYTTDGTNYSEIGDILGVTAGSGLTGGGATGTVTVDVGAGNGISVSADAIAVLGNSGITVNSTGVFVNTAYIGTLTADNANKLGTIAAANYVQNNDSRVLSGNLNFTASNTYFNTGLFVSTINSTSNGVSVNTTAIQVGNSSVSTTINATTFTGTANNATNLGGTAASGYQTTAGLSANVATLTANNTTYVGSVSAANVVSNAQLSANLSSYALTSALSSYQTTAGLSANVATLTANNATYLNGTAASGYQTTAGLSANVATLTANNSTNFGGQLPAYYTNASNITTGTLPVAQLPSGLINTTSNYTISGIHTHAANLVISTTAALIANNLPGTAGQVLTSNGTTAYWATSSAGATANSTGGTGAVQYYDGTSLGSSANMTFNGTRLTVNALSINGGLFTANLNSGTLGYVLKSGGSSSNIYWSHLANTSQEGGIQYYNSSYNGPVSTGSSYNGFYVATTYSGYGSANVLIHYNTANSTSAGPSSGFNAMELSGYGNCYPAAFISESNPYTKLQNLISQNGAAGLLFLARDYHIQYAYGQQYLSATGSSATNYSVSLISDTSLVTGASVTCSLSGGTLTVTAVASGSLANGHIMLNPTLSNSVTGEVSEIMITGFGTGTGGTGTYTVSNATASFASTSISWGYRPPYNSIAASGNIKTQHTWDGKLNSNTNSFGNTINFSPAYFARAWVNWNGTGAVGLQTLRGARNVTSVNKNAVGSYTINFTNPMPDVNYTVTGTCSQISTDTTNPYVIQIANTAATSMLSTAVTVYTIKSVATVALTDLPYITVAIHR